MHNQRSQYINSHNKKFLESQPSNTTARCNCRVKDSCPLQGKCQTENVVYIYIYIRNIFKKQTQLRIKYGKFHFKVVNTFLLCMSRTLLRFKSRWLLARDPRHFVFFDVFIKYKYLYLFSARRFTIILFRSSQHTCASSIHSLQHSSCDSRAPQCELNEHTQLYPYHLTHIHF